MTTRRTFAALLGATALAVTALPAAAQEVTLKLHQFLPAQANVPKLILDVWADNVEESSGGRIEVERYPSMQLGGSPPQLIDQAIDGVADVVWTVVGYTPGRFPSTEVFELPFMVTDARAGSAAYWQMFEEHMQDEFADVKILGTWIHGPGMIHSDVPVSTPDDMKGLKIRGATRQVNALLQALGAEPVGMPVPAIPEALSKGVIDGTTIPWEVTPALKLTELVENHTEFEGAHLYNVTFVLAMNKDRYESLPDDLKAAIDENSGLEFSIFAGGTQSDADGPSREVALDAGNTIITVSEEEAEAWREAAQPVYDTWLAEMEERGIDGQALIDQARQLMADYEGGS
ncbi:TRAP transporter substrate-binding protein [Jannaschia seohaensis]|uniref:TRAP-type C4-dicarboxylate transport system substrate-binding protein n=1 Tax=Jannaschia seohaensis TaxID=475081 RepID=A0A2Y9BW58_9RHOB|nr:TRAP transporter substrate-binding protein [Jannaschia seohaensis]PWJ22244.1 TRAP-type C4-dicarboxylate transport system substrate-binding protein [Jannaschia seohaensis]SSA38522.1 TRAP-type C4-dicarboxylate transport system, substrate-binding protein [Jannaschia seohaensis]